MHTLRPQSSNFSRNVLFCTFFAVSALLNLIFLFTNVRRTHQSVFSMADLFVYDSNYTPLVCAGFLALFAVFVVSSVVSIILNFKNKNALVWPALVAVITNGIALILNFSYSVVDLDILLILSLVVNLAWLVYAIVCSVSSSGFKKPSKSDFTPFKRKVSIISGICFLICGSLLYFPLCSFVTDDSSGDLSPMTAFTSGRDSAICLVFLALVCTVILVNLKFISNAFKCLSKGDEEYTKAVSPIVTITTIATAAYFVSGAVVGSIKNTPSEEYSTNAYIPFIIAFVLYVIFAFMTRNTVTTKLKSQPSSVFYTRLEFFGYSLIAGIFTVIEIFSDIIMVSFEKPSTAEGVHLNGYKIFMSYNSLESGFQLVAFFLFAGLCIVIALLCISLICLIRQSKLFYKITLCSLVSSAVISLLIGLFGKYYEIVQHINRDAILKMLEIEVEEFSKEFEFYVTSTAFYWFLAVAAVMIVTIIRRPYSKGTVGETPVLQTAADSTVQAGSLGNGASSAVNGQSTAPFGTASAAQSPAFAGGSAMYAQPSSNVMEESVLSNPCPAFSEIDGKAPEFALKLAERRRSAFEAPTLQSITEFVVSYARDCRLHLSYSVEDIATFIAGLGATRLTILQGMSGTGKTSLPKIFSEAVFGNCEIIEVESSWRDKNELLGFYNEFSKSYTPKKFTQSLYRAALNKQVITFIVLDEMNLSRIEYYFSDFLSLMENEEDKREIKLLNIPLFKNKDGVVSEYSALTDGHTIKIPSNIWFIGTANRDESTFEISDKVYDRAHTMNFNKRASKPLYYGAPIDRRYLSVDVFSKLLSEAKEKVNFSIDNYPLIKDVEKLLAPYNISFGNRIANQIEDFVSIYASCFDSPESVIFDAVEKILLSKVISKLELKSVENKAALAGEFEKLRMTRAAEFILKLNED